MLHFICSHFPSPNNSSVRFGDAVIYRLCCNCSNEGTLKRERSGCRGNPCLLPGTGSQEMTVPIPQSLGTASRAAGAELWAVPADRNGILAKPGFAIQQSLLPSEGIFCSSHSPNSDLLFYSNKGPMSRASANRLIGKILMNSTCFSHIFLTFGWQIPL